MQRFGRLEAIFHNPAMAIFYFPSMLLVFVTLVELGQIFSRKICLINYLFIMLIVSFLAAQSMNLSALVLLIGHLLTWL